MRRSSGGSRGSRRRAFAGSAPAAVFHHPRRRRILPAACGIAAFIAGVALVGAQATAQGLSLKAAAAAKERYFGAALDPALLDSPLYRDLAAREFSSITPENAMKWASVEPARGSFNWAAADQVAAFAKAHHQALRGHNLIWPNHLPDWVTSGRFTAAALRDLVEQHVAGEVTRYRGAVDAWDVVNEPFDDAGDWRRGVLYDALGADYVAIALRAARRADPGAKLYINEYNVEGAGAKSDALYELVASLKRSGAPIDGVGVQAHLIAGRAPPDLRTTLAKFAALGLDVAITELDLRIELPASAQSLARQAEDYRAVAAACLAVARCVGVTTWGLSDDHSWIPAFFPGYGAALLFDARGAPKPAYAAVIEAFSR